MKKFSELVVGDSLFIYDYFRKDNFFKQKIKNIKKLEAGISFKTENYSYITFNGEVDYLIIKESGKVITESISTSMDRLLLELEEC